jgi:hypothetical protein
VSDATSESVHDGDWPSWEDQLGEAADLDLDGLFDDQEIEVADDLDLGIEYDES